MINERIILDEELVGSGALSSSQITCNTDNRVSADPHSCSTHLRTYTHASMIRGQLISHWRLAFSYTYSWISPPSASRSHMASRMSSQEKRPRLLWISSSSSIATRVSAGEPASECRRRMREQGNGCRSFGGCLLVAGLSASVRTSRAAREDEGVSAQRRQRLRDDACCNLR